MFIHFDVIHERGRRTDRHCMTAKTALCIASCGKNVSAERVWTPGGFQTVGAAAQNALAANYSGCCLLLKPEREELKLSVEFWTDGNREFHTGIRRESRQSCLMRNSCQLKKTIRCLA